MDRHCRDCFELGSDENAAKRVVLRSVKNYDRYKTPGRKEEAVKAQAKLRDIQRRQRVHHQIMHTIHPLLQQARP